MRVFDPTTWDAPFPIVVAALFVIVMCRANATYWLGRAMAAGAHRTRAATLMDSDGYRRAQDSLSRWGAPVVSASFLTIGFQTLVNLAAGAMRMPLPRYLVAVTLGSVAWAFLYAIVGFVGFEAVLTLWRVSPILAVSVGTAAAVALAWYIVATFRRRTQ